MEKSTLRVCFDDSIMIKGEVSAAGSAILQGFVSPLTATAVERARAAGMELAGRTAINEFGIPPLGADTIVPGNCLDFLADNRCDAVFCNDYSGTLRRAAPKSGAVYIHPTYGTVSRFGLIAAMSSADQAGVAAKRVADAFDALTAAAGHDRLDGVTYPAPRYSFRSDEGAEKAWSELRVGIPANLLPLVAPADRQAVETTARQLRELGARITDFELPYADLLPQVHYILFSAEISNNITRFDGVKFGRRAKNFKGLEDLYLKTRTEAFGPDAKLAAIVGAIVLSEDYYRRCYHQAMQIRRLFKEKMDVVFRNADAVLLPITAGGTTAYQDSAVTAPATLAGLPSLSVPAALPGTGLQIVAQAFGEPVLRQIGLAVEAFVKGEVGQ